MRKLAFIIVLAIVFVSCNKSESKGTPGLWIRIENKTTIHLPDLKIGDVNYGDLAIGATTEYKLITQVMYTPVCQFTKNGREFYAGLLICGTPPLPPAPEAGYYTFSVQPENGGYHQIVVTKQ
jgi:hypothetical protein